MAITSPKALFSHLGFILIILFFAGNASSEPIITEFVASNNSSHFDGDGFTPDWIEIYNPDSTPVDLANYRLTDDPNDTQQWIFPSVSIPAGGFLVVFASGNNTPDSKGNLHTNFKLSRNGDYLAFYSPTGTLLSEFDAAGSNFPSQETDVSWGHAFESNSAASETILIGNGLVANAATQGNGSFEDLSGGVGVGSPNRFGINSVGNTATIPSWTATLTGGGFAGFDNDNTGSDGAWYAFVNHASQARFQSDSVSETFIEGDVINLTFDFTTNATGGTLDFTVRLIFDNGSDVDFSTFSASTPVANVFAEQSLQHTITAAQAGANNIAVRITADNNTGGVVDQPRFDNVQLIRTPPSNLTLIPEGSNVRYLVPTNNSVDSTWFTEAFDDSTWTLAPTPLGYETAPNSSSSFDELIATNLPSGTTTTYLRKTFTVTEKDSVTDLLLELQYEDGFVAYLNGVIVESQNRPSTLAYNSISDGQHSDPDAINFVSFSLSDHLDSLKEGENVLAIHALNLASSSDYLINPRLLAIYGSSADPVLRSPLTTGPLFTPSPGTFNSEVRAGAVFFSDSGGIFSSSFSLTLTPEIPSEEIRFTIDGTEPTSQSALYTTALPITSTTPVRARAFSSLGGLGNISGETFIHRDSSLDSWSSNLPVLVLDNNGAGNPLDKSFRDCFTVLYEPDVTSGETTFSNLPTFAERSAWHRRGSSSFTFSKPNYRLEIRDQNDEDKDVEILGMPANSDWVLLTFARFDRAMIRNPISREISDLAENYAPRTRYVEVFFNQDGDDLEASDYFGIYAIGENIKQDNERINVTKLETSDTSGEALTGGYVIKSDRTDSGDFIFSTDRGFPSEGQVRFVSVEPAGPDMTTEQKSYIENYVEEFEDALFGTNFRHPVNNKHYSELIDVDSFVDQHIFQVFNKGPDALRFSTFFHKDRGEKLKSGPIWDQERIFGVETDTGTNRARNPENWNGDGSVANLFAYDWYGRLFSDPDFTQRWIDRWQELSSSAYSSSVLNGVIDGYESQLLGDDSLDSPVTRNFIRWGSSASNNNGEVWPNARIATSSDPNSNNFYQFADPAITSGFSDPAGAPTASNILAYWRAEMDHARNWMDLRITWIYDELPALPGFSQASGIVTAGTSINFTPPSDMSVSGQIWYTTDGSDPRASGGSPSSSAILWDGNPISISSSQLVTCRALDPNNRNPQDQVLAQPNSFDVWSAPAKALYEIGTQTSDSLVISEINYHPYGATTTAELAIPAVNDDDFEFLEILNTDSTHSINLAGATFTEGITFTFSNTILNPGERAIIVSNQSAFEIRYGTGLNIVGTYTGQLDNSGERITLVNGSGQQILSVEYQTSDLWSNLADGRGSTLILSQPSATDRNRLGKSYSWSNSSNFGGTPDAASLDTSSNLSIVINEVLAHTDLPQKDSIELYNPTESPVNIGGWYLSDSAGSPLKFQIPADTILAGGAYIVFDEDDFNPTPLTPAAHHFALSSSAGDEVYLSIANAENDAVTNFVDHISFGASFNGQSIGRWPNGSGRFTPLSELTLGASNAQPPLGPIIISEIHYHPGPPSFAALALDSTITEDDLEFIEIHNIGSSTIDLTNWRLRGEGDFDFPAGLLLGANSTIVVVSFNPNDSATTARESAFRAHYGIGSGVLLYGGFTGTLNNSEGRITLQRPDSPPSITPPHVVADEFVYDDLTPWPAGADGTGLSLTRGNDTLLSLDPTNWFGATSSPGTVTFTILGSQIALSISDGPSQNQVTLSWDSVAGGKYEIQTSSDLLFWNTQESAYPSDGNTTTYSSTSTSTKRFFRIRQIP